MHVVARSRTCIARPKVECTIQYTNSPTLRCLFQNLFLSKKFRFLLLAKTWNLQGNSLIGYPVGPFGPTYYYIALLVCLRGRRRAVMSRKKDMLVLTQKLKTTQPYLHQYSQLTVIIITNRGLTCRVQIGLELTLAIFT